jgi:hypothetical protein
VTSAIQHISKLAAQFGAAWNRFWFTPADTRVPSLLRVLTGLLAIYYLLSHTSDLIVWFGPYGLLPADTVRQLTGGGDGEPTFRPSLLNYLETAGGLWAFHAVAILIAIGFTAGLFSRVTNVLTLAVVLCYVHRAPMITGQFEPVLTMLLCYLALAPTGAHWSLDERFRRTPAATGPVPSSLDANVSVRLIQLHGCALCALTGLTMLSGQIWWSGEAVWWLIARPDSRLFDLTWLHNSIYLINFWTHAIVAFALVFPLLIWNRDARPLLVVAAAVVWLSIGVLTGLMAFAASMIVASVAFLPAEFLLQFVRASSASISSR